MIENNLLFNLVEDCHCSTKINKVSGITVHETTVCKGCKKVMDDQLLPMRLPECIKNISKAYYRFKRNIMFLTCYECDNKIEDNTYYFILKVKVAKEDYEIKQALIINIDSEHISKTTFYRNINFITCSETCDTKTREKIELKYPIHSIYDLGKNND